MQSLFLHHMAVNAVDISQELSKTQLFANYLLQICEVKIHIAFAENIKPGFTIVQIV